MMRKLTRALAILLLPLTMAPAAQAWEPPRFRHNDGARDMRDGPGQDRWTITLTEPRSGRTFIVSSGASETLMSFGWAGPGQPLTWDILRTRPPRRGFRAARGANLAVGQRAATLQLAPARGGWRLRGLMDDDLLDLDVRIRSFGPGPTLASRHPDANGLLRRAMPVMDGVANGRFRTGVDGHGDVRFRRWRATIVHDWWADDGVAQQCCDPDVGIPYPRCCQNASVAIVRGRGPAVVAVGGTTVLSSSGGGDWRGVIARRSGGRLRWCHARQHRLTYWGWDPLMAESLGVRCRGGPSVRVRVVKGAAHADTRYLGWVGGARTRATTWLHRFDWTTQSTE